MATPTSAQSSMGTIEQFIRQLGGGQTKQAEAGTEPGSIGGATSHPVKNVDDRTEPAKEGARSKENATDVKEDQGKPSVESAPDATAKSAKDLLAGFAKRAEGGAVMTPGSAADDHLQIGTNVQATGDDKSNETSSAKAGKEDPGSSHPARTDNDALDGHKYAGDDGLKKIAADMEAIAGRICNQIVAGTQQPTKQAAARPAGGAVAPQTAFQAGWEAAGLPRDKRAADAMVHQTFCEIIKTAGDDADNVIEYLDAFFGKQAEGEIPPVDPSQMAGGPVDPMGGGGGGEMGGGGDPMGGMGGGGGEGELMDALGGGEPAGGMGGMEGGGPGGPGGGEGGVEDVLALMDQLGVTPEDILAAAEEGGAGGEGGGGGGGGDPLAGAGGGGGGGEPPPEKAGSDRKGRPVTLPPGFTKAAMKTYLEELVNRSRAKK